MFQFLIQLILVFLIIHIISMPCPKGHFSLPGLNKCHKWLNCQGISEIKVEKMIGYGAVKNVYLARWRNHSIVWNELQRKHYQPDFESGLNMLIALNPSPLITQLLGLCFPKNVFVTEFHKFNNAINIKYLFDLYSQNSITNRLKLCLNYAEILEFIHQSPVGIRVNCDSNDLLKLLSQLLVTDKFTLILNDLDALPEVINSTNITCGSKPIISDFVAPEQRVHNNNKGYNEKTDIWKAANVCEYFIQGPGGEIAQYKLYETHKMCKSIDPSKRPSASYLVHKYEEVLQQISSHDEF